MCMAGIGPMLSMGLGVMSSVASYSAQQDQWAAQMYQWDENYQNSLALDRDAQLQLTTRQLQEQEAYSQKQQMTVLDAAQKEAQVTASAAKAGVAGPDVADVINGVQQQVREKMTTNYDNWQMTASQLQSEKVSQAQETTMRIESEAQPAEPNPLSSVLTGAGAVAKGATDLSKIPGSSSVLSNPGAFMANAFGMGMGA